MKRAALLVGLSLCLAPATAEAGTYLTGKETRRVLHEYVRDGNLEGLLEGKFTFGPCVRKSSVRVMCRAKITGTGVHCTFNAWVRESRIGTPYQYYAAWHRLRCW